MEVIQGMAVQVGLVSLFGGLIALDRRSAFQLMLSQPLIAVSLVGFGFGQLEESLWMGCLLQLLWMSAVLFGANVPQNDTVTSVIIAGTYFLFKPLATVPETAFLSFVILLGLPFGHLGKLLDIKLDYKNLDLATRADEMAVNGHPSRIAFLTVIGLMRAGLAHSLLVASGILACLTVLHFLEPNLTDSVIEGLEITGTYIIPALGLAVALSMLARRRAMAIATLVFAILVIVASRIQ